MRALEVGLRDGGEEFGQFLQRARDYIALRCASERARGADYQLQVSAVSLVIHPLNGAVEQRCVWQAGDLAIEPEMDAGDRGVVDPSGIDAQARRHSASAFRWQADDVEIRNLHNPIRKF